MQIEILILAGLLLAVIVLLVFLLRRTGGSGLARELDAERQRANAAAVEAGQLRGRLESLSAEIAHERGQQAEQARALAALNQRVEREATQSAEAEVRLGERDAALVAARARIAELEEALERQRETLHAAQAGNARLQAELQHARQAQEELRQWVGAARENLSAAFTELAGKVFDEKGQQFEKNVRLATGQSRTDIEAMLKPFADKLGEFRQRVDTLYGEEARERASLLGAVGELKTLNQDMAAQAAALTSALKGSAKVRGDWGELMLDNVLRGSGLEEGVHYARQAHATNDEGASLRPDVVVRFPDQRSVVIDSKVNLVAWQEAMNAATPEQQDEALRRHAIGLRQHVKELGDKNYPKAIGGDALDVTIAFVPIEGALSAALGVDMDLQSYAFDRRVVFASPNTLMALLRVTERLWTRDKVQRQALEISDTGGKVLDALSAFLAEFDSVGRKLEDASQAFGRARNRLTDSPQSLSNRARRLAELGSKARKALPPELQPEAVRSLAAEDDEGSA
ncbi:recombinase RmuC [Stenotrophomonas daejeonensis]|uniref:Recombinase RmuC n=1 Tax=Stenotrophomonas daejeonensis TaxID=659018 RepID=A0A0R0E8J2_9GAMM|nr:DNA recombination protein RmuC [Stenotrophomonas daejeonensis]KRG86552.1 recombinase RmuC [Stenotrophomonas daejeonensis]